MATLNSTNTSSIGAYFGTFLLLCANYWRLSEDKNEYFNLTTIETITLFKSSVLAIVLSIIAMIMVIVCDWHPDNETYYWILVGTSVSAAILLFTPNFIKDKFKIL